VSAQAKPISQVVKDFEQSLRSYRPSTRRVYVAGARAALRGAGLELWQNPSTNELLASIGKSPTPTRARISPFLTFLVATNSEPSASDQDLAALRTAVIERIAKQMRLAKNPSIASRRDMGLDRRHMRRACQRNSSEMARKLPQNRGKRSAFVGRANPGTMLRACLTLLARLERAAGPP
jgi:hypothetical protein